MKHQPILPAYIDSTMMSCFRSCPKKFYREFVLGLRPSALSVDLHAGGCFASALESFYEAIYIQGMSVDEATRHAYSHYMQAWGDFVPVRDTPKNSVRVWGAVEDYIKTYPPHLDKVQPYRGADGKPAMEFTFAIPLTPAISGYNNDGSGGGFPEHPVTREPFLYSGRFDMLGSMDGRPVVRDEKTTKSISSNWSQQWDLRSQFSGYVWACQQSGLDLDTVVIRGIGILKTMFHQVEAIKNYNKTNVSRWHEQLRRDMWRLVKCWNEDYFDYNLAESCSAYGGCPFIDLCNSPDETRWYDNYTVRRWNPLLKNPIDEETHKAA